MNMKNISVGFEGEQAVIPEDILASVKVIIDENVDVEETDPFSEGAIDSIANKLIPILKSVKTNQEKMAILERMRNEMGRYIFDDYDDKPAMYKKMLEKLLLNSLAGK